MELERDTLTYLIGYLKKHGYPEDGFAVEYKIGDYQVDLAIIDPVLKIPVILFELKSGPEGRIRKMGIEQLKRIRGKYTNVPLYLVYPKDRKPFFEIERVFLDEYKTTNNKTDVKWESEKANYFNLAD